MNLEKLIPEELHEVISEQAKDNPHFDTVYRVAKWGKIENRAFYSTYKEIKEKIIPDNEIKYPKNEIGTYSTSVYLEPGPCRKYINFLGGRLRRIYPCPIIIKGKTSNGMVQRTIDRIPSYPSEEHIDWWIFEGEIDRVINDFSLLQEGESNVSI